MSVHVRAIATLGHVVASVRQQRVAKTVAFLREACGEREDTQPSREDGDGELERQLEEPSGQVRARDAQRQPAAFEYVERW